MSNVTFQRRTPATPPEGTAIKVTQDENGDVIQHVITDSDGVVSELNSTEINLAAGATFEGTFEDVSQYGGIRVSVYSSHESAEGGLAMWCSKDGTNGFADDSYSIRAETPKTYAVPVSAPFFKIRYTNGGTQTTTLNICTMYQKNVSIPSSHRIGDTVEDDDDAQLVQAVLKAQRPQGNYTNIDATAGGNLKVSVEEADESANIPISFQDTLNLDAFGRLRTSEPTNRFDVEFIYDKQPLIVDEVTAGGATATHDANARDIVLDVVNATNGTSAEMISHYNIPYTPGNSQLVEITGTLDNTGIGGGTAQIFHRSKVSGTVVETTYDQANWNVSSENDIDWSKSQIFLLDFKSLKVGRARFGFSRGGKLIPVHFIQNDNIRATGYWQFPSQPVRWRIYNDATYTYAEMAYGDDDNALGIRYRITANADATMRAICATVKSEGGQTIQEMPGYEFSISNGTTPVTVSTTKIPVLSIRPSATFNGIENRSLIIPKTFEINVNNPIFWEVYLNPTLTGASWTSVNATYSAVEYDVTASAFSGGVRIASGYIATGRNTQASAGGLLSRAILSLGRTGTADILTLTAIRTSTSNAETYVSSGWKEIR